MLFCSTLYMLFLALVVLLYWRVPKGYKVPILLLASYVFYMSWSPPFGLLYAPVIFFDSVYFYLLSRAMVCWPQHKKGLLIFGITTELSLLAYFKYANFLAGSFEGLMLALHQPVQHTEFHIFLPLAISFTNFVLISYLIDVYRGDEVPDRSFLKFGTYVAFFPHLIAGPIVRAKELQHQFDNPPDFSPSLLARGLHKYWTGFFIKAFVADVIAVYVDTVYGNPSFQAFNTSWVASYGFAVQIFCDFFGYTLMAQGSALMMGYTLPDNFNAPYFAKNMSEFWRRWHISLSRWLKDYLYIPLGGNRCSKLKTYRNLFITMGLGGLWHGANWTFIIWGLYQGLLLCVYKLGKYLNINRFIPAPLAILLTFHMICFARVFFRSPSLGGAMHMLGTMMNPMHWATVSAKGSDLFESGAIQLTTESALWFVLLFFTGHAAIRYGGPLLHHPQLREACVAVAYCVLLYFGVTMIGAKSQSFIYFQF